jgi:hypothetical protein
MSNELICVVCESPLLTAEEEEVEICDACLGNADNLNKNKNQKEIEDQDGYLPVAVDRMLSRGKKIGFTDFFVPEEDEPEDDEND